VLETASIAAEMEGLGALPAVLMPRHIEAGQGNGSCDVLAVADVDPDVNPLAGFGGATPVRTGGNRRSGQSFLTSFLPRVGIAWRDNNPDGSLPTERPPSARYVKESRWRSNVLISAYGWRRSTLSRRVEPELAPSVSEESPRAVRPEVVGWHDGWRRPTTLRERVAMALQTAHQVSGSGAPHCRKESPPRQLCQAMHLEKGRPPLQQVKS
jgi:hypothetical protein